MSATKEELLKCLKENVEAMYWDFLMTGEISREELIDKINEYLDELGA